MKKLNKLFAILFAVLGVGNLSAQTDVTSTYLTNADFSSTDGWTAHVSSGYRDYGQGNIGTYAVRTDVGTAATVDETHLASEYCFGFEVRWANNYASYYQETKTALAVGYYTLTYDVQNTNANTTAGDYGNLFYVEVGGSTCSDVSTEWMSGGTGWTTHTISFAVTSETSAKISLGLGSGSTSIGHANTPVLYVSHLKLTYKTFDDVSAENPADFTSLLVNPSFETGDMTGWSVPKYSSDTKVWPNSNGTYTTSGVDGNYLFNTWWQGVPVTQTVANLPNGKYTLNVLLASDNGANLYLLANDEHSTVQTITGDKKTFIDASFDFKVLSGQATIGVVGGNDDGSYTADGYWWYKADNFRLTYKGADITLELEALEANLAKAKAIDQTTIPSAIAKQLDEAVSAAEDVEQALNPIKAANSKLIAAINLANEAVAPYASLKELISLCETYAAESYSLVGTDDVRMTFTSAIATAKTDAGDAASASDLNTAYNALENARQAYVVEAIPAAGNSFDMTFLMTNPQVTSATGWTNGGTATGQQYTGAPDNTYLDFYQVTRDMYQTLSGLPNGSYSVKAATRGHTDVTVGYIYVKNGENKVTEDIHKVGNSGNTLGGGWDWTTTDAVSVTDGQLTIGFYAECGTGQWVGADNFTLYRTFDVTAVQPSVTDYVSEANPLTGEVMNKDVATALASAISAADATSTDPVALDNMIKALIKAIADAEESINDYIKLKKYIDMTTVFTNTDAYQAKYDSREYTSDDVETVRRELNVKRFEAASAVFTNNIEVTGWEGTMGGKNTGGQHWDGTTETKYYDNNSNNGSEHSTTTSITLPQGSYVLKAALRSSANTTLKLTVLDNVVDVDGKGDHGYGIDVNGNATFADEATYANEDKGRGWEWEFVKFELAKETEVTLKVECNYNGVYGWASFSDITLWMDDATYVTVYGKELAAPLAEAKALVGTKPMGTEEDAALVEAIVQAEGTISTPAELNTAVDDLKTAVANANVWVTDYNAEKDTLVAALERFEADYNNAEKGALDYMAKSRWATVIEKAQAAAVAKDVTNSYAGFEDATNELLAALDAATVSVNEYAALDNAITEAEAVAAEGAANWGDEPFQRPESAREGLNTAIANAQAGYDNRDVDGEGVTALIDAMVVTLNAPEAGNVYSMTVAIEGHGYNDCPVVATLGATGDNNPTGYGFAAKKDADNYPLASQLYTFTQVEGNKYNISVKVKGETVYLTYGELNGSAAGWKKEQIQGNTDKEKAGEFEIVASATTEGVFKIRNTITGTNLDCQDDGDSNNPGSIYTDGDRAKEDFALTSVNELSADISISAENKFSTCVLMFDADLTAASGLTVYVPEKHEDGYLILNVFTENVLPAYTPCLLYAEDGYEGTLSGTVVMEGYAAKVTGADVVLYGAIEDQTISAGYVLQKKPGEEVAKFYNINGREGTIPAGKCWLDITTTTDTPSVTCLFRGGIANNIDEVMVDKTTLDGAIYTLDGKRVSRMERGKIYIINGQKVMVK